MAKRGVRGRRHRCALCGCSRASGTRKTEASFASALENSDAAETDATTAAFQTIDAKASGLLTHVSMMIAGLGICMPLLAQHRFEEAVIIAEMSVYLLIAVGCLRCLSVVRSLPLHGSGIDVRQTIQRELVIRHELYRLCNQRLDLFYHCRFPQLACLVVGTAGELTR